jgi:phage replication initiation protein
VSGGERGSAVGGGEVTPPDSNTGVENTVEGVSDLVDWVAFTLPGEYRPDLWADLLGDRDWEPLPNGHKLGYAFAKRHGHITLYWKGLSDADDMGSHVEISGQGCRELEADGTVADWCVWARLVVAYGGKPTRLDVARDDRAGLLDLREIECALEAGAVQKDCRDWEPRRPRVAGVMPKGDSLLLGSRASDSYLRVYDKAIEQARQERVRDAEWPAWKETYGHHIRVELELRRKQAQAALVAIAERGLSWVAGRLRASLNVLARRAEPGENKARVPVLPVWARFLAAASKVRLAVPGEIVRPSVDKALRWISRQVATALTMVREAHGDLAEVAAMLDVSRLKRKHYDMILEEQLRWSAARERAEVAEVEAEVARTIAASPRLRVVRAVARADVAAVVAEKATDGTSGEGLAEAIRMRARAARDGAWAAG